MDTETKTHHIIETTPGDGTLAELHERYAGAYQYTIQALLLDPFDDYLGMPQGVLDADVVIVNSYDLMLPRVREALDAVLAECQGEVILLVQATICTLQPPPLELADVSGLVR